MHVFFQFLIFQFFNSQIFTIFALDKESIAQKVRREKTN